MKKEDAKKSIKKITSDSASLEPSSLVTLFEIDISEIAITESLLKNTKFNKAVETSFKFHNNVKSVKGDIWFGGKKYIAAPIQADGFEMSSKGTLPRPRLSLTVSDQGISLLSLFKDLMRDLDDLVGSRVIRRRTFLKYVDKETFYPTGDIPANDSNNLEAPSNFDPDPNAQFPEDIYYIDRKSGENKLSIEFELSSALELEEIRLPGRLLSQQRCPWTYRGEGCCYEFASRRIPGTHEDSKLPSNAPAIANEKDELISNIVKSGNTSYYDHTAPIDRGMWSKNTTYSQGETVFIQVKGINYYYVAKVGGVISNEPPPNTRYWAPDQCSKTLNGCKFRWGPGAEGQKSSSNAGHLPFGGFPGISRRSA
jgi:lambda family phage minor tail protein L